MRSSHITMIRKENCLAEEGEKIQEAEVKAR